MALLMAVLMWVLMVVITVLFAGNFWHFPELISTYGEIDNQFYRTLLIVGIAFVLSHIALGYFIFKYRDQGKPAEYSHGNTRLEVACTILVAIVFIITAFLGQRVWARVHLTEAPPDAVVIEVTGQQFAWNFRYPGPDKKFGNVLPEAIDDQSNPVGVDPKDPAGKDDIVQQGKMVIPVNKEIKLILRSKDVTHSFFVPGLRFKQDAVPGLQIPIHFIATKTGEFEIACAELCGLGHYKMRGKLTVMDEAGYEKWLKDNAPQ
jgi:cytochrome c oxidase subunit 2